MALSIVPYVVPEMPASSVWKASAGLLTSGGRGSVDRLERAFADYVGTRYAVAFASARSGLYQSYRFFVKPDSKVALPSYTCIPAIDAARWAGSSPVFMDIDIGTYNPVLDSVAKKAKPSAISLSYLYGMMGDIQPSLDYAKEADVPVIEDSAIALGASYKKRKAGSIGDAGVFSLQDSKMISSWRGGVVTTNNREMRDFLVGARERQEKIAKPKAAFNIAFSSMRRALSRPWAYGLTMYSLKRIMTSEKLNPVLGSIMNFNPTEAVDGVSPKDMPAPDNARYTELQASVALASLRRIDKIIRKRRSLAKAITEGLDGSGVIVPDTPKGAEHSYGRMPIRIEGASKFRVASMLLKLGIETAVNYPYICPETEHFKGCRFNSDFRNARVAARETVLLPMHTKLGDGDVERIVSATREVANLL